MTKVSVQFASLTRGGAVWQLVGLITRRSQVQILSPQPVSKASCPAPHGLKQYKQCYAFKARIAQSVAGFCVFAYACCRTERRCPIAVRFHPAPDTTRTSDEIIPVDCELPEGSSAACDRLARTQPDRRAVSSGTETARRKISARRARGKGLSQLVRRSEDV